MQEFEQKEEVLTLDLNKPWPGRSDQIAADYVQERPERNRRPFITVLE